MAKTTPKQSNTPQDGGITFRPALLHEDEHLSRILTNAFLPIWNHNWFQGISSPIQPIPLDPSMPMSRKQRSRLRLYRALIRMVRNLNGQVLVAEVASPPPSTRTIAAGLLWLPPHARLNGIDIPALYRSGVLSLIAPWNYGLTGGYRIEAIYEHNVMSMFTEHIPRYTEFREQECAFVQMIAANPACQGKGYASRLLDWQIKRHFEEFGDRPVILDTTTVQAVRAYERLGFTLIGETPVKTATDADGFKLKKRLTQAEMDEVRKITVQRVMMKLPPPKECD